MSRKAVAVIAALIFSHSSAWADPPLPAGKPAGVKQAQAISLGTIAIGALVVIAVAGYAISTRPITFPARPR